MDRTSRWLVLFAALGCLASPTRAAAQGGGIAGQQGTVRVDEEELMEMFPERYPEVFVAPVVLKSSRVDPVRPAPLTKMDGLFAKRMDLDCRATPLHEVIARIGREAGVKTMIDRRAMEAMKRVEQGKVYYLSGADPDAPITFTVTGIALASCLDDLCEQERLAWTVRNGAIEFTARLVDEKERLFPHVHDVSDLIQAPRLKLKPFGRLIQDAVGVAHWEAHGGGGSLREDATAKGSFLVVRQTLTQQRRVAGILEQLRRLKATPAGKRVPLAAEGYWSDSAGAARQALDTEVDAAFDRVPLADAVAQLSAKAGVPIGLDRRSLDADGVADTTRVTYRPKGKAEPLALVLDQMLAPLRLTISSSADRLVVTTNYHAHNYPTVAVYPVDHLIQKGRTLTALVDMLTANVTPEEWIDEGGGGYVRPITGDVTCLVIAHTAAGHREADAFLRLLR
jgi:hypothetical protein